MFFSERLTISSINPFTNGWNWQHEPNDNIMLMRKSTIGNLCKEQAEIHYSKATQKKFHSKRLTTTITIKPFTNGWRWLHKSNDTIKLSHKSCLLTNYRPLKSFLMVWSIGSIGLPQPPVIGTIVTKHMVWVCGSSMYPVHYFTTNLPKQKTDSDYN